VVALVLLSSSGSSAARADDSTESWSGQLVLPTKEEITFSDSATGKQVYYKFDGIGPFMVREDRLGRLRLFDGHKEGWALKSEFILSRKATAYFTDRIRANPNDAYAWNMRGRAWVDRKEYDNAIKDYTEAIRLDPKDASTFNARGVAWSGKKDYDRAIKDYTDAIRLDPKRAMAFYNRGLAWRKKKDYDRAIKDYDEAIRLNPNYAAALNNTAWLLATCPEAKYRDGKRAVELATRACELSNWKEARYITALAAAHAEAGNFEKAIQYQKQTLDFPGYEKEYGKIVRELLKLYADKIPFHEQ
jgi:tetratricopeptide (TPR) repeat protein